jgi:hypothetical protein
MSVNKEQWYEAHKRSRCQGAHLPGKEPSSSSSSSSACAQAAKEEVDGLLLCEEHALEVKLEGQIACWEEMLFHIDLWSREASRRQRPDVVGLLDAERAKGKAAIERAHKDLDVLRRGQRAVLALTSGWAELYRRVRRGSLPHPPKAVRQLSLGLRHPGRR